MSSYKKLFECVRPDFICNLTATRTEEQGVMKLTLRSEHENVELYGFEDLADSVSDLLSSERITISKELGTYKEFGTIRIECWVNESYSERWCDRAHVEQT